MKKKGLLRKQGAFSLGQDRQRFARTTAVWTA